MVRLIEKLLYHFGPPETGDHTDKPFFGCSILTCGPNFVTWSDSRVSVDLWDPLP